MKTTHIVYGITGALGIVLVVLFFNTFRQYLGLTTYVNEDVSAACQNAMNVQAFGAKGDGETDDTNAIQAAAVASKTYVRPAGPTSSYIGSSDPICFPAGNYVISSEIALKGYANIYGDGDVQITQLCDSCNTFVFRGGYTIKIRNLKFTGGKHQIYFDNANVDTSIVTIENSTFSGSTDYAIYTHGTTDGHLSAEISIFDSQFVGVKKVLRNVADYVVFRDSSITLSRDNFDSNSAAIWNRESSSIFMNNVTATANLGGALNVRWMDNYGNFFADASTFTGENSGIPVVYQLGEGVKAYPWIGKSVSIRNSTLAVGPVSKADAAVIVLKEAVPQLILMQGNSYTASSRVAFEAMNVKSFVDAVQSTMPPALKPRAFSIQVEDAAKANIPSALQGFILK